MSGTMPGALVVRLPRGVDRYTAAQSFEALRIPAALCRGMREKTQYGGLGFTLPSKVQAAVLPYSLQRRSVIIQAMAGAGKTAAFVLTALALLKPSERRMQALLLSETRELAMQTHSVCKRMAKFVDSVTLLLAVKGGDAVRPPAPPGSARSARSAKAVCRFWLQGRCRFGDSCRYAHPRGGAAAAAGAAHAGANASAAAVPQAQVVVGTIGFVKSLVAARTLDTSALRMVVVDEADAVCGNSGQTRWVEQLLSAAPQRPQLMLVSATFPEQPLAIARRLAGEGGVEVRMEQRVQTISEFSLHLAADRQQTAGQRDFEWLREAMESLDTTTAIIFANTRACVDALAAFLAAADFTVGRLYGSSMAQPLRDRVVQQFRDGVFNIMITTDVVGRGLDVPRVSLVVNIDPPRTGNFRQPQSLHGNVEQYLHRIGRTGRFGKSGCALTITTSPAAQRHLREIEGALRGRGHRVVPLPNGEISELDAAVARARAAI